MADEMRDLLNGLDRRLRALERRPAQDLYYVYGDIINLGFSAEGIGIWYHEQGKPPRVWWAVHEADASSVALHPDGVPTESWANYKAFSPGGSSLYTGTLSAVHVIGLFPR